MAISNLERTVAVALDVAERTLRSATFDPAGSEIETARIEALLSAELYRDWYCGTHAKSAGDVDEQDLAELLRAAHAGTYRWDDGWQVANVSSHGRVAVHRGRERRIIHVIDCVKSSRQRYPIKVGDTVSVVSRRDSETMNPGDWVTFGTAWPRNREPLVRVYWNVMSSGVVGLVTATTELLSPDFPYFLKCPRKPSEYRRIDAVVLYLPVPQFGAVRGRIAQIHTLLKAVLDDAVPPLAKRLAPGLGLAEDPMKADESFGTNRCDLIARGICRCASAGVEDRDAWLAAVLEEFAASGIPSDRAYVNSVDSPRYDLP